ncbi:MAG: heavy metal-binding domain-containing protein [Cyanobacteriota bacterium]
MKKISILSAISVLVISSSAFAEVIKPFQITHNGMSHEKNSKATKEIKVDDLNVKFYLTNLNEVNKTIKNLVKKDLYACSMHPFAVSEKKENCPICNMTYSKNTTKNFNLSKGNYHLDIVVNNNKTNEMISDSKVKVKIIAPDKKEETKILENKMGFYASTFNLKKLGKYEVIASIKKDNKDKIAKFYYENK